MHQPLAFHDKAMDAALAMQAAHRQGKAWPMHDKMFEDQQALTRADLENHAKAIGLDMARFKRDMDDPKLKEEVLADQRIANSVGASGTPTFFVNGRQIVGAQPFEQFKQLIDEQIKKADELIKQGVPRAQLYDKLSSP
jgi:protein-disulfide isomerase